MRSARVALFASVIAVTACIDRRNDAPPPGKLAEPAPLTKTERRVAEHVETGYVGVLTPREAAEVTAPFGSQVLEVYVKLGDHVEKGTSSRGSTTVHSARSSRSRAPGSSRIRHRSRKHRSSAAPPTRGSSARRRE